MFKIKKILVPTDFSDNAAAAYNPAHQFAIRFGSTVDFIHIIPTIQYFNESMSNLAVPLDMEKDLYPKIQIESSKKINALMDDYLEPGNKGKGIVEIASKPSRAIADYAEKNRYDLILMAANGQHQSELFKGSITKKVIRYSSVPVLSTDQSNLDEVKNILVPTDGSQTSLKALPLAIALAITFKTGIILFHAQELYGTSMGSARKSPLKSVDENIRDTICTELEDFFIHSRNQLELRRGDGFDSQFVYCDDTSSQTINVQTVIEKGISAHYAITEYAEANANMVVMATHGRSGFSHLLLGSTAEKVARHLKLPVVTVKPNFDKVPDAS